MTNEATIKAPDVDFNTPALQRHRKIRAFKDRFAASAIGVGGMSIILAITLIFFYLMYEVVPLFKPASIEQVATYARPGADVATKYLYMEEQGEQALRIAEDGSLVFFNTRNGQLTHTQQLPVPAGVTLKSVTDAGIGSKLLVAGLSDGTALLLQHAYKVTYPNDQRVISPVIEYPFGETPLVLDAAGSALTQVALRDTSDAMLLVAITEAGQLVSAYYTKEENFLSGELTLEQADITLPHLADRVSHLEIAPDLRWLYVGTESGKLDVYDLRDKQAPVLNSHINFASGAVHIETMQLLLGGMSLIVGDSDGNITQLFMVRDSNNQYALTRVRDFTPRASGVSVLAAEQRRKGFLIGDKTGHISIFNATANRQLLTEKVQDSEIKSLIIAPRANYLMFENGRGEFEFWSVDNEHPEVSWSALWGEVWYEGYAEPDYIWQSSSASNDFEPKYSLVPLAFGTIKAAFYAMLIATPLAICGALYTAYFMAPGLRRKVKPSIELMEALPTVILGFLAGLFFAPYMELHLPGVFTWLLIMPLAFVLFGFVWANLPQQIRHLLPDGWMPVILLPLVVLVTWLSFWMSPLVEHWFFGGDMRHWITDELGIGFDQRNALVVGFAMGFAVIPTIFSITEDAVFSVPKHLSYGSLALGATQWQTMIRVVLPTASPGIFSAIMIGMGRAVGETMIVLMATGNTPVMEMNIFEGLRTLSANIAVEMPESEVASTHFRILFLAAFVLFLFTFVVNTVAEYVRQRLRNKYSVI